MTGKTVTSAVLLLIMGNLVATFCDAFIKAAGQDIPVFQFIFIRAACTFLLLLPFYRFVDWKTPLQGAKLHLLRGNLWILSSLLLIISLQVLPLATANAIFYTAPIIIVVLSTLIMKEQLTRLIVLAVAGGFIGILIILRPSEFDWGIISALAFSFVLAINSLLIRKMPKGQTLLHGLILTQFFALPFSLILCFWEGAAWNLDMIGYAIGSAICSIGYSVAVMLAYRYVAASKVASAEYTGLIFAVLVGWLIFNETPDLWLGLGALFIIIPIVLMGRAEKKSSLASA
ncbi:hypothetical protein A9Q77_01920 [Marinomonas sp. 42_23_T18]|nr:hypothetical protein A9Q77_01920 [Marinomonas sp. 42_23_T18]